MMPFTAGAYGIVFATWVWLNAVVQKVTAMLHDYLKAYDDWNLAAGLMLWTKPHRHLFESIRVRVQQAWVAADEQRAAARRAVLSITGGLLFSSNATTYAHNFYFQVKIALIAVAGINMAVYHLFLNRGADSWHTPGLTPLRARLVGGLSLCLWIAIAAFGRWIGFTINTPT